MKILTLDALIEALEAAMMFQDEEEQKVTKILIEALEAAKIFQ